MLPNIVSLRNAIKIVLSVFWRGIVNFWREKMMNKTKGIVVNLILAAIIISIMYGGYKFEKYLWDLQHPNSPEWVFWLKGGK
jgi:hypothetical protein